MTDFNRGLLAGILVTFAIIGALFLMAQTFRPDAGTVIIFEDAGAWYCQANLECEELR